MRLRLRLVIGSICALAVAGVAITSAAGDSGSVSPQRACSAPTKPGGPPRARCYAEFIPISLTPAVTPRVRTLTPSTSCPVYWSNQGQGKSPCEILKSYDIPAPTTASASQVIGIVDAFDNPNIESELATFNSKYGLASLPTCTGVVTQSCFQKVNQNGAASPLPSSPPSDDDWMPEISLDVESAHAVCPNCKILLVEANSDTFANLAAAVSTAKALGATVISNSYGLDEPSTGRSTYNAYAPTYDNGVPMFVSAGDDGWGPAFPADVPAVISVGGTTLTTNSDGSRSSESVWSGTGSGCSSFASASPWQPMSAGWSATGCGTKRSIADVSAVADPGTGLIIYTEGGWWQYGGTSLSSPLIAAMYALAANGTTPSSPTATAYWNPGDFFDITTGSNGSCSGKTACKAGTGYDGPTGIGTPNGVDGFAPADTTPTITSFDPASGGAGTTVELTGTFIGDATSVKLGSVAASFTTVSPTELRVTVPATATTGTVSVTTPDGTAVSADEFDVTVPAPTITGFTPAKGVEGALVKVTGTNLADVTSVELNGTPAVFDNATATSLTFGVPAGATSGTISVTNDGGTATSLKTFSITPTISSFTPASGIVTSTFDVTGTGLAGVTAAKVGGKAASVQVNSDTSVTVTVPAGAASGKVSLTGPGGTATSHDTFTVIPPPAVTGFSPKAAIEGATVKVSGKNLAGASTVTLDGDSVSFTVLTATSLTFTVPADAHGGQIAVTTSTGVGTSKASFKIVPTITSFTPDTGIVTSTFDVTGTGFNDVTSAKIGSTKAPVTVNSDTSLTITVPAGAKPGKISVIGGGTAKSATSFTVLPPPQISGLSPGKAIEGATVKVTGANLTGATQVTLGGDDVAFTSVTARSLTFTVPADATPGHVTVTTPYGTSSSKAAFAITPVVTSFAPAGGPVSSTITLTGTGFNSVNGAKVGGKAASYTVLSDTSMTVTVPTGAGSGKVTVTTTGSSGTSKTPFTVTHTDRVLAGASLVAQDKPVAAVDRRGAPGAELDRDACPARAGGAPWPYAAGDLQDVELAVAEDDVEWDAHEEQVDCPGWAEQHPLVGRELTSA